MASVDFGSGSAVDDFAGDDGPQEVDAAAWDGLSLWIGRIPTTGIVRRRDSVGGRCWTSSDVFLAPGAFSDELAARLAHGEGLDQRDGLSILAPGTEYRSWALVTYRRQEDAQHLYELGLQLAAPDDGLQTDEMVRCLVRRTVDASTARQMLEESAERKRRQRELCTVAISRIQGWLKHSGRQLAELFAKIDADGSGEFDVTEFRAAMLSIGLSFDDETVHSLMTLMDTDGGGSIDKTEFVQRIEEFADEELGSANEFLAELCAYIDRSGESIADICRRNDRDGSGDLSVPEFHNALIRIGINVSMPNARKIMEELDMDGYGELELTTVELNARLSTYRRKRRALACRVLNDVFAHIEKTKASVTRIFSRVDASGSGVLDMFEFQEALLRMGQELTPDQVRDVMAELDCDSSGSVSISEFLDKLKLAESNRAADMRRCKALFERADSDGNGHLDRAEVQLVTQQMGFGEQLSDPGFADSMIEAINAGKSVGANGDQVSTYLQRTAIETEVQGAANCEITFEDFIEWYFAIGKSYLDRPCYTVKPDLVSPTSKELADLFMNLDVDGSGSVDLSEVQDALQSVWPHMDPVGFQRAFAAADQDGSGCIDEAEFKHLIEFLVYFNRERHTIQELDDAFSGQVGEDEFYFGCQCLKLSVNGDEASKFLFEEECRRRGNVDVIKMDAYMQWAVRYACVAQRNEPRLETEAQRKARVCTEMSKELEHAAGEYGDVHMIDLVGILTKNRGQASGPETTASRLRASIKRATGAALECSELIKRGIEHSINENDGFPTLTDASLRMMAQMCRKEEFFSGQNIITQGEIDTNYYVIRRGRVQVLVDDVPIRTLEWGMAFGEIGLLLNTKRTTSISALTPCEVYVLERADYETVLSLLPEDQRLGPLSLALNQFWALMTGPDGSRRQSIDFKTYLKAHIRTSKTLTSNSSMDDFDEDEERQVAQSDWAEDCERCGMKITETLTKEQYFDAMYQLVELWSDDCNLSFATFLNWVFENIAMWNEDDSCWVFRDMNAVECVGDKFEELKEEARAEEAAKEQREAEVIEAAEEARKAHAEQVKKEQERVALEKQAQAKRQEEQERHLCEADKLAAGRLDISRQLSALADEEAELQRRLANGELTLEEEMEVRARLMAIATERDELKQQFEENEYSSRLAGYDRALSNLDSEEAELRRRLAAGELSSAEEDAIRKRLAEVTGERDNLLRKKHEITTAQQVQRAEHLDRQCAGQIVTLDHKLRALEDEETDLLRRLASGELTLEEEAQARARLAAIAHERSDLQGERNRTVVDQHARQQQHETAQIAAENGELDNQLATLDDEEAELQRRLNSGDLSLEEEAEVRARLSAIEQERTMLRHQQHQNVFAAQHVEINAQLSALDDEEMELHRKLASGELSPEEEYAIRQRLEDIQNERKKLRQKQLGLYREEEEAALQLAKSGVLSEQELKRVQNRVNALHAIQHGVSDGVGELTSEEEELAALGAERQAPAQENESHQSRAEERQQLTEKLYEVNAQLSALDDEEAKLRRKLAAGELSPEEEAAILSRLGEIEQAKTGLRAERAAISALQDVMDASELAAAEQKRHHQLTRDRNREKARRKRNNRRRQNLFATIRLDPKQGFHEEAPAPTMRFHGVGQPKVQSVQQASERLEPLRQSLGETLQPAALVGSLSARSTRDYGRMDWNQTIGSFGSTLGSSTTSTFGMAMMTAGAPTGDTELASMASASAPVPLQFSGSDQEELIVAPVLVRSRTLEAKDKATKSSPTSTRALVEALDEVAVVRCPVVPRNSMGSMGGTSRLPPVRRSPSACNAMVPVPRSEANVTRAEMELSGLASDQGHRRRQRRRQQQAAATSRSSRGYERSSSSALPVKSTHADCTDVAFTSIGKRTGVVGRSQSIGTFHSVGSNSGLMAASGDGVDLGRNGLPVSLARALAMKAQAEVPEARLLPEGVTHDMHPRAQRQQLRLRLGTAVRGRRLAS